MQSLGHLRAFVVLKVLYRLAEEGVTPRQRQLLSSGGGLLDTEWRRLGMDQDVSSFGFNSAPILQRTINELRECGLMVANRTDVPEGMSLRGIPYLLTERGRAVAAELGDDWQAWPEFQELCDGE